MIKIYLEDYPLEKIDKQTMKKLEPYYQSSVPIHRLFSPEGIFRLQNNKIIKIIPQDKPIHKHKYTVDKKNMVLLIDESIMNDQEVLSQIPYEHITHNITEFHYSVTPSSQNKKGGSSFYIHLVIEGNYESESDPSKLNNIKFIPTNFYFLANEKIDNYLIQKDFNVFLSMLI